MADTATPIGDDDPLDVYDIGDGHGERLRELAAGLDAARDRHDRAELVVVVRLLLELVAELVDLDPLELR